jgi:hypothetical protein
LSRLSTRGIEAPAGTTFGLGAVLGSMAFGQFTGRDGAGIGQVDLNTGAVQQLTRYATGVSGLGAMAADPDWLVWEQLDSTTNLSDWSVHALRRAAGTHTVLATSRTPAGGFLPGQQPIPVLRNGVAAWAQPVSGPGGAPAAEVWAVQLATGQKHVLDAGLVSSPVYAGGYLVWAKVDAAGRFILRAVDGRTLAPVGLPNALAQPGSVGYLAGSPDYLVWSSQDTTTLTAWRLPDGPAVSFASPDAKHFFQFLQVSGDFLVWYAGASSALLDLRTGRGFDLPGTVAGSAQTLAVAQPGPASGSMVSDAPVAGLPRITACP